MELRQPEPEDERRHEDDPAAHAEEPGEHSSGQADQRDEKDRQTISLTPTAASTSAKPYASSRSGTRCWRDVPSRTPATAGSPTIAAAPGFTSPCSA